LATPSGLSSKGSPVKVFVNFALNVSFDYLMLAVLSLFILLPQSYGRQWTVMKFIFILTSCSSVKEAPKQNSDKQALLNYEFLYLSIT